MPALARPPRRLVALLLAIGLLAAACSSTEESDTADAGSTTATGDDAAGASETGDAAEADATSTDDQGEAGSETGDATTDETETDENAGKPEPEPVDVPSLYPLTITDAAGQEFTFDAPPRLGCIWTGCVEAAAAIGLTLTASVVSDEQSLWPFYGGGSVEQSVTDWTNPEEWAAIEVDAILASVAGLGAPVTTALDAAAPIFYLHYDAFTGDAAPGALGGNDSYLENLRILAQIADDEAAGAAAIGRFETMRDNLAALATPETAEQTIAVLFGFDGYASLGPTSAFCALLSETGHGTCVGEGIGAILNSEGFLDLDPDVIIATSFGGTNTVENREENDPVWPLLTAVQNGEVYRTDRAQFYCCSASAQIMMAHEYVALLLPDAGIERPDETIFDPAQSPLATG